MLVVESFVLLSGLIIAVALIFMSVYALISLMDVDSGFINPAVCCSKLNQWALAEVVAIGSLMACEYVSASTSALLINFPLFFWSLYRYCVKSPRTAAGVYDPSAMNDSLTLAFYTREAWVKLIVCIMTFLLLVYGLIWALLAGLPSSRRAYA